MKPVISLRDVSVRYGATLALQGIDLELGRGERVALAGPSGAGKTTLLGLLNGTLAPATGTVEVLGQNLPHLRSRQLRQVQARVGTVPQQFDLVGPLRVVHNVNAGRLAAWSLAKAAWSLVSPRERVVVVEDAGELRPRHPHVISLEARPPNIEGAGEVSLRTLVRQALRMRPDRLVVGEVRGAEVVDLLAAMNTGHEGGCSTVHANSATDLPARFEALGVTAGMSRDAVGAQLAAAVDVVLHLRRDGDGRRRMTEIGIVDRSGSGPVRVLTAVSFQPGQPPDMGPGAAALEDRLQRADSR